MDIIQEAKEALEEIELGIFVDSKYQKTLIDLISRLVERLEKQAERTFTQEDVSKATLMVKKLLDRYDNWDLPEYEDIALTALGAVGGLYKAPLPPVGDK